MDFIAQLVASATATAADIKKFVASCQETFAGISTSETVEFPRRLSNELRQSKQVVLADVVELQRLIMGPSDLIQQLACHVSLSVSLSLICFPLCCFAPINLLFPLGSWLKQYSVFSGPNTSLPALARSLSSLGLHSAARKRLDQRHRGPSRRARDSIESYYTNDGDVWLPT